MRQRWRCGSFSGRRIPRLYFKLFCTNFFYENHDSDLLLFIDIFRLVRDCFRADRMESAVVPFGEQPRRIPRRTVACRRFRPVAAVLARRVPSDKIFIVTTNILTELPRRHIIRMQKAFRGKRGVFVIFRIHDRDRKRMYPRAGHTPLFRHLTAETKRYFCISR